MQIDGKEIGSFEIVKYDYKVINGQPKIVIEMVKVLDKAGNYLKFAKLEKVLPYLAKFPIKFKEK